MSEHVHYDLDQIEQKHRVMLANMQAQAHAKAETPEDHRFLDLQARCYELAIQASLICAAAENDGYSRDALGRALGAAIGTVSAQFMGSNRARPLVCMLYQAYMAGTLDALLQDDAKPDGCIVAETEFAFPVPGGHA